MRHSLHNFNLNTYVMRAVTVYLAGKLCLMEIPSRIQLVNRRPQIYERFHPRNLCTLKDNINMSSTKLLNNYRISVSSPQGFLLDIGNRFQQIRRFITASRFQRFCQSSYNSLPPLSNALVLSQ